MHSHRACSHRHTAFPQTNVYFFNTRVRPFRKRQTQYLASSVFSSISRWSSVTLVTFSRRTCNSWSCDAFNSSVSDATRRSIISRSSWRRFSRYWNGECFCSTYPVPGNTKWGGRLSTVGLLIKVACCIKKANIIFDIKKSWSKVVVQGGQLYWAYPLQ